MDRSSDSIASHLISFGPTSNNKSILAAPLQQEQLAALPLQSPKNNGVPLINILDVLQRVVKLGGAISLEPSTAEYAQGTQNQRPHSVARESIARKAGHHRVRWHVQLGRESARTVQRGSPSAWSPADQAKVFDGLDAFAFYLCCVFLACLFCLVFALRVADVFLFVCLHAAAELLARESQDNLRRGH